MKSFRDKVAIVTGGASGIGRAVGAQLAAAGANVVLADIDEPLLRETAGSIGATARVVDVVDANAMQALADDTVSEHGRIDYMFNNAGIAIISEVLDMGLDDWNRIIDINIRGVVHGIHAVYPIMCTQGFGHIVNTASLAGLAPAPSFTAYSATKHAVVGLSRGLRAEARAYGVKVSVVCPGFIDTPIVDNATYRNFSAERLTEKIPYKMMTADTCARHLLRGVARNKLEIVVTLHGRNIYRMQRMFPGLVERLTARQFDDIRSTRDKIAGD
jgi:NADP-dependent 3-hydroxy acid dehydrogenase YdfG